MSLRTRMIRRKLTVKNILKRRVLGIGFRTTMRQIGTKEIADAGSDGG